MAGHQIRAVAERTPAHRVQAKRDPTQSIPVAAAPGELGYPVIGADGQVGIALIPSFGLDHKRVGNKLYFRLLRGCEHRHKQYKNSNEQPWRLHM